MQARGGQAQGRLQRVVLVQEQPGPQPPAPGCVGGTRGSLGVRQNWMEIRVLQQGKRLEAAWGFVKSDKLNERPLDISSCLVNTMFYNIFPEADHSSRVYSSYKPNNNASLWFAVNHLHSLLHFTSHRITFAFLPSTGNISYLCPFKKSNGTFWTSLFPLVTILLM